MKTKLMIILLLVVFLVACVGEVDDGDLPKGKRRELDDSYLNRTIDPELGVACYSQSISQVAVIFDCVKIDKGDIP